MDAFGTCYTTTGSFHDDIIVVIFNDLTIIATHHLLARFDDIEWTVSFQGYQYNV